jgi:RTX calcium-binding nonapeptide repeat (4 copies)/WD40-like Beta Propeller Repeat
LIARVLLAVFVAASALVASDPAGPAGASFPGRNGELVFSVAFPSAVYALFGDARYVDVELCTLDPGTGLRRNLTGPERDGFWFRGAAWSPDGTRLAVSVDYALLPRLALVPAAGGDPVFISDPRTGDRRVGSSPAWSPDGGRLAYALGGIQTVTLDGQSTATVAPQGSSPAWSPDGGWIAYVDGAGQLALARPDGSERRRLTDGPARRAAPTWSPDGSSLAFVSQANPGAQPTLDVLRLGDAAPRTLWTVRSRADRPSAAAVDPAWAPDGSAIAFLQEAGATAAADVFVISTEGGTPSNATRSPLHELDLDWRPLVTAGTSDGPIRKPCGVWGTDRADELAGTGAGDYILSRAGADRVVAGWGDDIVLGEAGADVIVAGPPRGRLDDHDVVLGGSGNDRITGGEGSDELAGGDGHDRISGGRDDDVLGHETPYAPARGGGGNDVVDGGPGHDRIYGGPGRDRLSGGPGDDQVDAGPGGDRVDAGPGRDRIRGGPGNDLVVSRDRDRDAIDCGPGRDRVDADRKDVVARNCEDVRRR